MYISIHVYDCVDVYTHVYAQVSENMSVTHMDTAQQTNQNCIVMINTHYMHSISGDKVKGSRRCRIGWTKKQSSRVRWPFRP